MPVTNNPILEAPEIPVEETVIPGQEQNFQTAGTSQEEKAFNGIYGLSAAEQNDPNSIEVTISDPDAPLVILFGPPACGKTMTLVRLTRFLKGKRYIVSPIRTFRPASDANYDEICNNFDTTINSNEAAKSTDRISFMLVEVIKESRRICQILEAPGEYYFNPQKPNQGFPSYVNKIISCSNRKVWTILIEPNWFDQVDRKNYVTKITQLKQLMRAKDRTIFVFNKIDRTNFVRAVGDVNMTAAVSEVNQLYPNIFVPFRNENPVTKFFHKYNCDIVPFQTGWYTTALNGKRFQEGPEEYCQRLWNTIMSKIRG